MTTTDPTPAAVCVHAQNVPLSSVQLEQAAKGPPRATVKVYHADPEVAMKQACELYDRLLSLYAVDPPA